MMTTLEMASAPDRAAELRDAVARCVPLFRSVAGCLSLQLEQVRDDPGRHLLRVRWNDIDDHRVGFQQSEAYARWVAIIGPLLIAPPRLVYSEIVLAAF